MFKTSRNFSNLAFFLPLLASFSSFAGEYGQNAASELTGSAGIINGNPPVISNSAHESGKIDITKKSTHGADEVLDIGDTVSLSWLINDSEGDTDITDSTIVWHCTDPQKNQHTLQTGGHQYVVVTADMGCTIGVNVVPTTISGVPRVNNAVDISDISTYSHDDNIPDGPVNPHQVSIKDYVVAPDTTAALTVTSDKLLHTVWEGAQVQLGAVDTSTDSTLSFSSSDNSVATVSATGRVTFVKKGAVTMTVKNGYTTSSISFHPQYFYIFADKNMVWGDGHTWCSQQTGYKQPGLDQLSNGKPREVPTDSLWQEWGESAGSASSPVIWSDTTGGEPDTHQYVYRASGHRSDNYNSVPEGVACISQ